MKESDGKKAQNAVLHNGTTSTKAKKKVYVASATLSRAIENTISALTYADQNYGGLLKAVKHKDFEKVERVPFCLAVHCLCDELRKLDKGVLDYVKKQQ